MISLDGATAAGRGRIWHSWFPASIFGHIDWFLFTAAFALSLLGLMTMRSFAADNSFFDKQIVWVCMAVAVFLVASVPSYSFLKRTAIISGAFAVIVALLTLIFAFGSIVKGAQNRFNLGLFFVQPSDPAKLLLVMLLAKYFARRHIEIKHYRHILISGAYAFVLFVLIFFQPDFGSAIIIFSIWFGMVLVAGISWKHLATLAIVGLLVLGALWNWGLHPYQKQRVLTFLHPLTDIQGSGYNAYQSTVAVGSGEVVGKGVGYGTQSKLKFLPEYQTDFIFAAYAEEWGFVGVVLVFGLFAIVILRTLLIASHGADNFGALFGTGLAVYFLAQFVVHVGMNIGLMPITGTTLPFMSYGGSHLLTEYLALGILMGMRRHAHAGRRSGQERELVGVV